jgi:hypothetical protein
VSARYAEPVPCWKFVSQLPTGQHKDPLSDRVRLAMRNPSISSENGRIAPLTPIGGHQRINSRHLPARLLTLSFIETGKSAQRFSVGSNPSSSVLCLGIAMFTPSAGCCAWPEQTLIVPTTQHPALAFMNHPLDNLLMHKNGKFSAVPDFIADCVCPSIRTFLRSPLVLG